MENLDGLYLIVSETRIIDKKLNKRTTNGIPPKVYSLNSEVGAFKKELNSSLIDKKIIYTKEMGDEPIIVNEDYSKERINCSTIVEIHRSQLIPAREKIEIKSWEVTTVYLHKMTDFENIIETSKFIKRVERDLEKKIEAIIGF